VVKGEPGDSSSSAHARLKLIKSGDGPSDVASRLDAQTKPKVLASIREGDRSLASGDHAVAFTAYRKALDLVPEPKSDHEEVVWLLAALGDVYLQTHDFVQARKALQQALRCNRESLFTPQLQLRLGQAECELGEYAPAFQAFSMACEGLGTALFAFEHPKYLRFLQARQADPRYKRTFGGTEP
jgi:tetratricopeptide (TPR) repeat protein